MKKLLLFLIVVSLFTITSNAQASLAATTRTVSGNFAILNGTSNATNAGAYIGVNTIIISANTTETTFSNLNLSRSESAIYNSKSIQPCVSSASAISDGFTLINLNSAEYITIDFLYESCNSLTKTNTRVFAKLATTIINFKGDATRGLV